MKSATHKYLYICTLAALGAAFSAHAQDVNKSGYAQTTDGKIITNPYGLCWRTGYFSDKLAVRECDSGLTKVEPPKPAPAQLPEPVYVDVPEPQVELEPTPTPKPVSPPPAPAPIKEQVSLAGDALFDSGKANLKPKASAALDELVTSLQGMTLDNITVTGHTDSTGSAAYNQRLSEQRATSVKEYLVSKGVDPSRIQAAGKGEDLPVANNATAAGRAANRRVEIEVVGTRTVKR